MSRILGTVLVVALVLGVAGLSTARADEVQGAVTQLLEQDAGSVVLVEFDLQRIDGRGGREVSLQGLVVGEDGLILVTDAAQVDPPVGGAFGKPEKIEVRFPGDLKKPATFVGKDEELNLALVRITPEENGEKGEEEAKSEGTEGEEEAEAKPLVVAAFDAALDIQPGQQLIALSRLPMADNDLATFDLVRVSTVIPRPGLPTEFRALQGLRGIEGCPIFTLERQLVGFVAASTQGGRGRRFEFINGRMVPISSDRTGYPTRILHAKEVLGFLADPTRHMRRDSWLGVKNLQALTKPLAEAYGIDKPGGIVVGVVRERSPAAAAGFEAADVIVAVNGEAIDTAKDRDVASFQRQIRLAKAGDKMTFQIARGGGEAVQDLEFVATLEESPLTENEVPEYHDERFGLKLKPLTRDFLERSRLSIDLTGVRVISVESASWASIAGIESGDVIRKMVLKPCDNLDQYKVIMDELFKTKDSEVCYNVMRTRKSLFLCVRPDWDSVTDVE